MAAVRELWTDERLDDLNHRVDRGFEETKAEFRAVRLEMRTEFAAVRSEMKTEFTAVRSEIAQLHRTLIQLFGGMMATMTFGFVGLIVAMLLRT
jgi:hypothetical protein